MGKEQALRVGTIGGTQEEGTTRGKKESPSIGRGSQTGTARRTETLMGIQTLTLKRVGYTTIAHSFSVLLVAIMSLCGNHKHIHDLFIDFVNKPVFLVHFP